MSDDHLHTFCGLIGACVIGALLWIFILWAAVGLYYYYFHECPMVKGAVAEPWVKAAMKRHGIQVAYETWDGQHYFIRGGRKCRL